MRKEIFVSKGNKLLGSFTVDHIFTEHDITCEDDKLIEMLAEWYCVDDMSVEEMSYQLSTAGVHGITFQEGWRDE